MTRLKHIPEVKFSENDTLGLTPQCHLQVELRTRRGFRKLEMAAVCVAQSLLSQRSTESTASDDDPLSIIYMEIVVHRFTNTIHPHEFSNM